MTQKNKYGKQHYDTIWEPERITDDPNLHDVNRNEYLPYAYSPIWGNYRTNAPYPKFYDPNLDFWYQSTPRYGPEEYPTPPGTTADRWRTTFQKGYISPDYAAPLREFWNRLVSLITPTPYYGNIEKKYERKQPDWQKQYGTNKLINEAKKNINIVQPKNPGGWEKPKVY